MRVAEQGDALRRQRERLLGAAAHVVDALARQAVHQIEIEVGDARLAQRRDGARDLLVGLDAADRLLHVRREILHAEAGAVDAEADQDARERAVDMARIELDRVLAQAREIERLLEPGDDPGEVQAAERGRRAAAPVQVRHRMRADALGDEADLGDQHGGVGVDRLLLADRLGVAAAIEAELAAERDVQIERERRARGQLGEPGRVGVGPDVLGKMRRGRIGGVARHVLLGENVRLHPGGPDR